MAKILIEHGADIDYYSIDGHSYDHFKDGTALIMIAKDSKQNEMFLNYVDFY